MHDETDVLVERSEIIQFRIVWYKRKPGGTVTMFGGRRHVFESSIMVGPRGNPLRSPAFPMATITPTAYLPLSGWHSELSQRVSEYGLTAVFGVFVPDILRLADEFGKFTDADDADAGDRAAYITLVWTLTDALGDGSYGASVRLDGVPDAANACMPVDPDSACSTCSLVLSTTKGGQPCELKR